MDFRFVGCGGVKKPEKQYEGGKIPATAAGGGLLHFSHRLANVGKNDPEQKNAELCGTRTDTEGGIRDTVRIQKKKKKKKKKGGGKVATNEPENSRWTRSWGKKKKKTLTQ